MAQERVEQTTTERRTETVEKPDPSGDDVNITVESPGGDEKD